MSVISSLITYFSITTTATSRTYTMLVALCQLPICLYTVSWRNGELK